MNRSEALALATLIEITTCPTFMLTAWFYFDADLFIKSPVRRKVLRWTIFISGVTCGATIALHGLIEILENRYLNRQDWGSAEVLPIAGGLALILFVLWRLPPSRQNLRNHKNPATPKPLNGSSVNDVYFRNRWLRRK